MNVNTSSELSKISTLPSKPDQPQWLKENSTDIEEFHMNTMRRVKKLLGFFGLGVRVEAVAVGPVHEDRDRQRPRHRDQLRHHLLQRLRAVGVRSHQQDA